MGEHDFDFQFGVLTSNSEPAHVARLCVLYPLVIRSSVPDWPAHFGELLALWRKQVWHFKRLGWDKAKRAVKLRNCYPSMCLVKSPPPAVYRCRLENVCPWCWGREAEALTVRVLRCLKDLSGSVLVSAYFNDRITMGRNVPADIRHEFGRRRGLMRALAIGNQENCAGWSWMVTCDPHLRKGCLYWRFGMRFLAAVRPGHGCYLIPKIWKRGRYPNPETPDVHRAVSAFFRYPDGLLRGRAEHTLEILRARQGLRLSEIGGGFRLRSEERP